MIEHYIDKNIAKDIFMAGYITGHIPEKKAYEIASTLEKKGGAPTVGRSIWSVFSSPIKDIWHGAGDLVKTVWTPIEKGPKVMMTAATVGASLGALGAAAVDAVKERVTQDDPETEFKNKINNLYKQKVREQEDEKWMTHIRLLKEDLKKNYKKMPLDEYRAKYNALVSALDERA